MADIPDDILVDEMNDLFGKVFYPEFVGRDGSRTPIPWERRQPFARFTTGNETWLPIPTAHLELAATQQSCHPELLLNVRRWLLHWCKQQPALRAGNVELQETAGSILALPAVMLNKSFCAYSISVKPFRTISCRAIPVVKAFVLVFPLNGMEKP